MADVASNAAEGLDAPTVERKAALCELSCGKGTSAGYITTPQVDRDNEIVVTSGIGLQAYKSNPILLYNHDWHEPPIGSQSDLKMDAKGLYAQQDYASTPFAQDILTLVREKHLRTYSIGFMPLKRLHRDMEGFQDALEAVVAEYGEYAKQAETADLLTTKSLLLETSVVNIPSNTGAEIMQVSKSLGLDAKTVELLKLVEVEDEPPEPKRVIIPKIRIIKRATPVDVAGMVERKIHLMKGGV